MIRSGVASAASTRVALSEAWLRAHVEPVGGAVGHRDPALGVVDENARVHGTSNLFIAGSSVFPRAGLANPTLTLVALAMRLADHIRP